MIVFRESMKSRKDAAIGGIVSEHGIILIKKSMELLASFAGFHTNNEFFQHCLIMRTSETVKPTGSEWRML